MSASGPETNDFVDPNSLIVMVASCRQTIMFSSDDNRSLHIIVCFYWKGQNCCWAIWPQFGGKGWQTDLSVIMDLIMCIHVVSYQSKSRNIHVVTISTGYGRHMARPVGPRVQSKLKQHLQRPSTSNSEHTTNPSHLTQKINGKSSCTNCTIFWHPSRPHEHSICHLPAAFSFNPSMRGQLDMTSSVPVPKD